ncbi:hypothetical protein OWR28_07990 [Chryseobacterium sp. 1B4]
MQSNGNLDYGWRQYMPDLGRWNGIDQLAEAYTSTSPYAYVANNPVLRFDVDGKWFNQDGSIDTSGRTPGFTNGRQMYQQFWAKHTLEVIIILFLHLGQQVNQLPEILQQLWEKHQESFYLNV